MQHLLQRSGTAKTGRLLAHHWLLRTRIFQRTAGNDTGTHSTREPSSTAHHTQNAGPFDLESCACSTRRLHRRIVCISHGGPSARAWLPSKPSILQCNLEVGGELRRATPSQPSHHHHHLRSASHATCQCAPRVSPARRCSLPRAVPDRGLRACGPQKARKSSIALLLLSDRLLHAAGCEERRAARASSKAHHTSAGSRCAQQAQPHRTYGVPLCAQQSSATTQRTWGLLGAGLEGRRRRGRGGGVARSKVPTTATSVLCALLDGRKVSRWGGGGCCRGREGGRRPVGRLKAARGTVACVAYVVCERERKRSYE